MSKTLCAVAAVAAAAGLTGCSSSDEATPSQSPITPPKVSATRFVIDGPAAKGDTVSLTGVVKNPGSEPLSLVGGSSVVITDTSQFRLVNHVKSGNKTTVKPVTTIPIPAGGTVVMGPTGFQIQLVKINENLKKGAKVPVNLRFGVAQVQTIAVVR